jgi:serine/threonine protein phosphatase 1
MKTIVGITDIHGRLDLFRAAVQHYPSDTHFIILGDVIDRGPHSLGSIELALELHDTGRATLIRGNHEHMALDALERFEEFQKSKKIDHYKAALVSYSSWMDAGGSSVSEEWGGFTLESLPSMLVRYLRLTQIVCFVSVLGITESPPLAPSILCSHAAPPHAREGMSATATALWLRPQDGPFPLPDFVVASIHGHTPVRKPCKIGNHIYTDMGAFMSDQLCTIRLDNMASVEPSEKLSSPDIMVFSTKKTTRFFSFPKFSQFPIVGQPLPFQVHIVL